MPNIEQHEIDRINAELIRKILYHINIAYGPVKRFEKTTYKSAAEYLGYQTLMEINAAGLLKENEQIKLDIVKGIPNEKVF